jgi:hypothetical protein
LALSNSIARCGDVPTPAGPAFNLPGFYFSARNEFGKTFRRYLRVDNTSMPGTASSIVVGAQADGGLNQRAYS